MSSPLSVEIKQRLIALARDSFNLNLDDLVVEVPPKTELGDLAFPVAFDLAKRIKAATGEKKNPRELATKLAEGLTAVPGVALALRYSPSCSNSSSDLVTAPRRPLWLLVSKSFDRRS